MNTFNVRITGLGIAGTQRRLGTTRSVKQVTADASGNVIARVEAEDAFRAENTVAALLPIDTTFATEALAL